jgi:ribosomal protein L7/L12
MAYDGRKRHRGWLRPIRISKPVKREADRRAGDSLVSLLDAAQKEEIMELLSHGDYVFAVRRVRELTGLRLIDAKRIAESLQQ